MWGVRSSLPSSTIRIWQALAEILAAELAIGRDDHHEIPCCVGVAGLEGPAEATVSGVVDDANLIQACRKIVGNVGCAVVAAVVDNQDLASVPEPLERGDDIVDHVGQVVLFVVGRQDDTPLRRRGGRRRGRVERSV